MRQLIIIAGSNRTGTSLLADILVEQKGFRVPDKPCDDATEYHTHESEQFRSLSRRWDEVRARRFVEDLEGDRILLKYPKASRVLERWLSLLPDARLIYVFRPREEAVESQVEHWWGRRRLPFVARWIYRRQWERGLLALADVKVPVCFVTFEELKRSGDFEFPASFGWNEDGAA
ncbi:MAG: hypothetical protein CL908_22185 [Deltaproteobacteria bacterium]|jgi:hypothetical protein|nr:hypothetical protein [Deltaproteobacteria bacterium]